MASLSPRARQPFTTAADEGRRTVSKLRDVPKNQQRCRIRHRWPTEVREWEYGEPMPKGISVVPYLDGSSQVVEECERGCGKKRVFDTLPGSVISADYTLRYRQDKRWVTLDPDSGITPRDIRRQLITQALTGRSPRR